MIHCLFEQSGTFKSAIEKLGGVARDYDIQNEYGNTDKIVDLFDQIERAYLDISSIFDDMKQGDMVLAFFPCTRFEAQILLGFRCEQPQQTNWNDTTKLGYDLYLHKQLEKNYELVTKLAIICLKRGLPLIIENPYSTQHYLNRYWAVKAKVVDMDRTMDGDYYEKPTQYWFIGCEPKENYLFEPYSMNRRGSIENARHGKERSEISPEYAEKFLKRYVCECIDGEYKL